MKGQISLPGNLTRVRRSEAVYAQLRRAIESGELKPGQMINSTVALAKELAVSHHAVTQAMARLVRERWVVRRVGAGTFVRDGAAARPGHASLGRVGLVSVPSFAHGHIFLQPAIAAARSELELSGVSVRTADAAGNDFARVLSGMADDDVVIWLQNNLPRVVELPLRPRVVFVAPDCVTVAGNGTECDIVSADSSHGGLLAGRHLRAKGCTSAIFVGVASTDGEWDTFSRQRYDGFRLGWGRSLPAEAVVTVDEYRFVEGVRCVERLLPRLKPGTGLFAASDDLAMGICHGGIAHGLKWGGAIRLIGFDGQPPRYPGDPLLTTLAAPLVEMGRTAAQLAIERAARPDMPTRQVCLRGVLRPGETG